MVSEDNNNWVGATLTKLFDHQYLIDLLSYFGTDLLTLNCIRMMRTTPEPTLSLSKFPHQINRRMLDLRGLSVLCSLTRRMFGEIRSHIHDPLVPIRDSAIRTRWLTFCSEHLL
ncbi:hypothetical protein AVEN_271292-1 [Araneus ventricosus]|uniref:Uncharacterized protein n=1 Tax=Araneus ventricosus TaxID=182803 RepID=A0A4Y2LZZ3_ARAVE|nr:hypothetical protein AVEN_2365-1 [Araneus ventricosus]GBN19713.1 hypothetical protein AVEN_271292-1 [Araneus ventricosus]